MKNRTDLILLTLFLLSVAFTAVLFLALEGVIDLPLSIGDLSLLALCFPFFPGFLLQLLFCRRGKTKFVRRIPVFLIAGLALYFFVGSTIATGWDSLGWVFLLLLCIAPAVGCGLAWVLYALSE